MYTIELFYKVLFAFLVGSVAFYLMLVIGALSFYCLRRMRRDRKPSYSPYSMRISARVEADRAGDAAV